jgi:hypothetical protein
MASTYIGQGGGSVSVPIASAVDTDTGVAYKLTMTGDKLNVQASSSTVVSSNFTGYATVSTAGTAIDLYTYMITGAKFQGAIPSTVKKGILIIANPTNSGNIYMGTASGVGNSVTGLGVCIPPGGWIIFNPPAGTFTAGQCFINAEVSGDGATVYGG